MRLVPCTPPTEPLDDAPRSALVGDFDAGTRWEGFWSRSSDAYYALRTDGDGSTHWFRMDDIGVVETDHGVPGVVRVLPFRGSAMRRVSLVVAESPSGRSLLVGTRYVPRTVFRSQ
jgi:hypothetical protein